MKSNEMKKGDPFQAKGIIIIVIIMGLSSTKNSDPELAVIKNQKRFFCFCSLCGRCVCVCVWWAEMI